MPQISVTEHSHYIPIDTAIGLLEKLGGAVCLSGTWNQPETSVRYDIMSAAPSHQLREHNNQLSITTNETTSASKMPSGLEWLDKHLNKIGSPALLLTPEKLNHLPVMLGFIGYASYDYGKLLETLPEATINDTHLPDLCGGIYHWNLINDKQTHTTYLLFADSCPQSVKYSVLEALSNPQPQQSVFYLKTPFKQNEPFNTYQNAFAQISRYISEGDCYQINYAHRHQAEYAGSPLIAYTWLNNKINTPYSAYLQFDDHQILCLSPERFINVDGNNVQTKPIKGTRPRDLNKEKDEEHINTLQNSTKDRAENLMIVDLLRNDLNRTCIPGSVKVPDLFKIETYPNVHHLVSTITGQKPESTSALEVFKQAFPGGSITGAPKIRAMEIIEELEPTRRSIYCGSIFYAGFDGRFDSNICIRTLLCKDDNVYCWGGGGIVADSNCEDEYQESITKVKNLMDELEKMSGLS
ncbi:aminodeoxychorismate synthase component I [Alkalimarinus alittae]|uniref:aminodeoxychorismate synthase n=1 Tax=Alkalimarinus alittae TaxID=2961619 RepID=A0ABY6N6U3_9ALTE|nr:aminodeoxychorismate synthase component I [Alkalimarinus alittae]UZE97827.1 aminodeoxychorismate synthase component I [Alkalimarinus alittae]